VVGTATATGGQLAGDPIYTISNDLVPSADLTVENLLFYENHLPVDFDTLDPAVPIDATGILETGAVLDGPGTLEDYSVPPIADGTFFISQGQVLNGATHLRSGGFVDGYTTTIPEPSTLAYCAPGCCWESGSCVGDALTGPGSLAARILWREMPGK
jgi:hypothetical protein